MELDQKSKSYQTRRVSPHARNATPSKLNSFPNTNIFSGDWPQRAARIDSSHGRNFAVTKEELKAFLGINVVMGINKLHTNTEHWRVDNLIGNDGIQSTMIWNRFNRKDDKTEKTFKMRLVIDHLNSRFSEVLPNDSGQSLDENMVKFKDRSGWSRT